MGFRVLVCGDRHWIDSTLVHWILSGIQPSVVIEGGAPGADRAAESWAENIAHDVELLHRPADWNKGRRAGPERNEQMLADRPDLVLAFHNDIENSKGTKDMVGRATKAGVPTYLVSRLADSVPESGPSKSKENTDA